MSQLAVSTLGIDTLVEFLEEHNCIFRDKNEFKAKITKMLLGGPDKLFCISDFDFTLSKYFRDDGTRADSCHASLEHAPPGFLPDSYIIQAKALQSFYYPLEIDTTISDTDKFRYMEEWVEKHNALLVESKITSNAIQVIVSKALADRRLILRQDTNVLVSILEQNRIPMLIFSAGIADVVEVALLESLGLAQMPSNISLISNKCIFQEPGDDTSPLISWSRPYLHVLNKRAAAFIDHDFFRGVKSSERCNLLLFGDSMGDPRMAIGIEDVCDTIVKIGFLNVSVEERREEFLGEYDVAILGDPELTTCIIPLLQLIVIQLR